MTWLALQDEIAEEFVEYTWREQALVISLSRQYAMRLAAQRAWRQEAMRDRVKRAQLQAQARARGIVRREAFKLNPAKREVERARVRRWLAVAANRARHATAGRAHYAVIKADAARLAKRQAKVVAWRLAHRAQQRQYCRDWRVRKAAGQCTAPRRPRTLVQRDAIQCRGCGARFVPLMANTAYCTEPCRLREKSRAAKLRRMRRAVAL